MSPHRDTPLKSEQGTDERHGDIAQIADEVHDRHHEPRQELGFPSRFAQLLVRAPELLDGLLLAPEGAHDSMTGKRLLRRGR